MLCFLRLVPLSPEMGQGTDLAATNPVDHPASLDRLASIHLNVDGAMLRSNCNRWKQVLAYKGHQTEPIISFIIHAIPCVSFQPPITDALFGVRGIIVPVAFYLLDTIFVARPLISGSIRPPLSARGQVKEPSSLRPNLSVNYNYYYSSYCIHH